MNPSGGLRYEYDGISCVIRSFFDSSYLATAWLPKVISRVFRPISRRAIRGGMRPVQTRYSIVNKNETSRSEVKLSSMVKGKSYFIHVFEVFFSQNSP